MSKIELGIKNFFEVARYIPVGFSRYNNAQDDILIPGGYTKCKIWMKIWSNDYIYRLHRAGDIGIQWTLGNYEN
jgi:hypothetical protein